MKRFKGENMGDFINANLSDLILYVLRQRAKFGNEITSEILELTNNEMDVKQATLYSTLKKLEQKRLITSYWEDSKIGGKRHYYFLTDLGREALNNINFQKAPPKPQDKLEYFDPKSLDKKDAFWHKNNEFEVEPIQHKYTMDKSESAPNETPFSNTTLQYEQEQKLNEESYSSAKINNDEEKEEVEQVKIEKPANTAIIIPDNIRTESNDIITNTINQQTKVEMRNTDIDYRNILGELYISEEKPTPKTIKENEPPKAYYEQFATRVEIEPEIESLPPENLESAKNVEIPKYNINISKKDFTNFGIKVKKHSKVSDLDTSSDSYLKINSLNFFVSLSWYIILVLGLVCSYFAIKTHITSDPHYLLTLLIVGVIAVLIPLVFGILFTANPHKKSKNDFNFKQSFLFTLLICVIFIIFVIAINLLAGMNNLNQVHFLFYWLIPLLLAIDTALSPCVKKLLILTKKFNA